ncbi:MAG: DUF4160 domain-containing protein [Cyanobacteriota bacterium]
MALTTAPAKAGAARRLGTHAVVPLAELASQAGRFDVYFHSHEPNEPPHVHVDRDRACCKMWLNPVALASSLGFKPTELRDIERLASDNRVMLVKAWEEFHG